MTIRTLRRLVVLALVAAAFLAAQPWLRIARFVCNARIARFVCNALVGACVAYAAIMAPRVFTPPPTAAQLLAQYMRDQQREMQWADQYSGTFIDNYTPAEKRTGKAAFVVGPLRGGQCVTYDRGTRTLCNQGGDTLYCEALSEGDPRPICSDTQADAGTACSWSDVDGTALVINCRSER